MMVRWRVYWRAPVQEDETVSGGRVILDPALAYGAYATYYGLSITGVPDCDTRTMCCYPYELRCVR